MMTIWHHRQTWQFFISAVYHTECTPYTSDIAGIYDNGLFDTQYQSSCHFYICCPFALKIHKVIENMLKKCLCVVLWNSCVWFWNYVPLKVVPLFCTTQYMRRVTFFFCFCRERSVILWNICVYRYHLCIQTWTALCKGWAKSLPNASNTRVGVLLICNTQQKTN